MRETLEATASQINNEGINRQIEFLLSQGVETRFIAGVAGLEVEWENALNGEVTNA